MILKISLILVLAFLVLPPWAYAHITKSDGPMSVMLHTDPDDEPIGGTPTLFHVLFRTRDTNFSIENCDCLLYVGPYADKDLLEKRGHQIAITPALKEKSGSRVYALPYTFPDRKGVYAVIITGSPKEGSEFEPFRIEFSERVARTSGVDTLSNSWLTYSIIVLGGSLLICLTFLGARRFGTKRPIKK